MKGLLFLLFIYSYFQFTDIINDEINRLEIQNILYSSPDTTAEIINYDDRSEIRLKPNNIKNNNTSNSTIK